MKYQGSYLNIERPPRNLLFFLLMFGGAWQWRVCCLSLFSECLTWICFRKNLYSSLNCWICYPKSIYQYRIEKTGMSGQGLLYCYPMALIVTVLGLKGFHVLEGPRNCYCVSPLMNVMTTCHMMAPECSKSRLIYLRFEHKNGDIYQQKMETGEGPSILLAWNDVLCDLFFWVIKVQTSWSKSNPKKDSSFPVGMPKAADGFSKKWLAGRRAKDSSGRQHKTHDHPVIPSDLFIPHVVGGYLINLWKDHLSIPKKVTRNCQAPWLNLFRNISFCLVLSNIYIFHLGRLRRSGPIRLIYCSNGWKKNTN